MPRAGQPAFPALGQYWIIDNGCNFDLEKVKIADAMFEKLRLDGIAEVAVICQTGIVDKGGTNDDKIWLRDWARWAKMGSAEDNRSVVWLIRPDAKPKSNAYPLKYRAGCTGIPPLSMQTASRKPPIMPTRVTSTARWFPSRATRMKNCGNYGLRINPHPQGAVVK